MAGEANVTDHSDDLEFIMKQIRFQLEHLSDPPTEQDFHFLMVGIGPPFHGVGEANSNMFMRGSPQVLAEMIIKSCMQAGRPGLANDYLKFINAMAVQLYGEIKRMNDISKQN